MYGHPSCGHYPNRERSRRLASLFFAVVVGALVSGFFFAAQVCLFN